MTTKPYSFSLVLSVIAITALLYYCPFNLGILSAVGVLDADGIGIPEQPLIQKEQQQKAMVITGTNANDKIVGTSHNDIINGSNGDDFIFGAEGNDTIYGGLGSDHLRGGDGNDILYGGDGGDLIDGDNGNDTLVGGPDNDMLNGGLGADHFECGPGRDLVMDFNATQGDTHTGDCEFIDKGIDID